MDSSNHDFPVAAEVLRLQKAAARNPDLKEVPPTKWGANGLLVNDLGKIWIPTSAVSMHVRLCVIAHCGRGGHRGHQVTLTAIKDHYYWKGMSKDVKVFVSSCFHCIASAAGETTQDHWEKLCMLPNRMTSYPLTTYTWDHPPMMPSMCSLSRMTTARMFGSSNARRLMLIVQYQYSSNGSLPLASLHNGFPTNAFTSRTK
jgi:hypothetical protein